MEIKINSKFDVGQEVYTCSTDTRFKNGNFQSIFIPDAEPKIIDKILITQKKDTFIIHYSCNGNIMCYPEDRVFETFDEAKKWCDNYE